jgi:hypothetical protein
VAKLISVIQKNELEEIRVNVLKRQPAAVFADFRVWKKQIPKGEAQATETGIVLAASLLPALRRALDLAIQAADNEKLEIE